MGGPGTGIQGLNALCVLSVNVKDFANFLQVLKSLNSPIYCMVEVYNEIVFVALWFWLFFLALATASHVVYLALLTAFPALGVAVKSLGMDEDSKV